MTTKKDAANQLFCWWGDTHIATLRAAKFNDIRLTYSHEAQELWPINTPLLSCSLPVQSEEQSATPFFKGLLPEGSHLETLSQRIGASPINGHPSKHLTQPQYAWQKYDF